MFIFTGIKQQCAPLQRKIMIRIGSIVFMLMINLIDEEFLTKIIIQSSYVNILKKKN